MSDISRLDALLPTGVTAPEKTSSHGSNLPKDASFSDILKGALSKVNDAEHELNTAVTQALESDSTDIADTMIALQKADVSLKMMLEVRNKILEAYQEVIRTQI